jgi:adenylate kinase
VHISTGNLLRESIAEQNKLGLIMKAFIDRGELVPDDLIVDMVVKRLQEIDCMKKGWVLDGFPRTKAQAEALNNAGIECDGLILLELPDDVLIERVSGRRLDPETGEIYHIITKPPETEDVSNRLIQRSDDSEEQLSERLTTYHAHLGAILKLYDDKVVAIDGNRDSTDVWADVLEKIKSMISKYVIFTLGPPCSGKRTHSSSIENDFGVRHLSVSDLINQESYHDTDISRQIEKFIEQGKDISSEIIVTLIRKAIYTYEEKSFIVNAFPRNMEDMDVWTREVSPRCVIEFVTYLNISEVVLLSRLASHPPADNSGKEGNTVTSVAKRYKAFVQDMLPVVEFFRRCGKLREISAVSSLSVVYDKVACLFEARSVIKAYERTVLLITPDAVSCGQVPAILDKVKSELYLAILTTKFVVLTPDAVDDLYRHMKRDPQFHAFRSFLASGPSLAVIIEGSNAVNRVKVSLGPDDVSEAIARCPASFRAQFGTDVIRNACRCSQNDIHAFHEIDFWTNPLKLGCACAVEGVMSNDEGDEPVQDATKPEDSSAGTTVTSTVIEEDTLALLKPCSSEMHHREITALLMGQGFRIISEVKTQLTLKQITDLYGNRMGKIPYVSFQQFMLSGPVVALHVKRDSAIVGLLHLIGFDDIDLTRRIRPDSIRALFASNITVNAVESSESSLAAIKELSFYFPLADIKIPSAPIPPAEYVAFGKDTPKYAERARIMAKRRKKNQAPPPLSLAKHAEMLKYLADDVDVIFKELIQRIIIKRPKDVLGYAIKDLIEQQRLSLENSSRVKGGVVLKPIKGSSPTKDSVLAMSSSLNALPPMAAAFAPTASLLSSNSAGLLKDGPAPAPATNTSGQLEGFYVNQDDDDDYDPTFNGKVLTTSMAHAEILRLRETIKAISDNLSAEKSRVEASVETKVIEESTAEPMRHLDVLHVSDWVGFGHEFDALLQDNDLARYVAEMKANATKNELILFSGNFLGCNKNCTSSHFSAMFNVLSIAGVNYGVLGNRDFEYGIKALEGHIKNSSVTWILSNVVDPITKIPIANCEKDAIICWNGISVGILGFVDNWINDVRGVTEKEVEFLDIFSTATKMVNDLKTRGAEVILAVTHCARHRVDEKLSSIDNIDLILGGHSQFFNSWKLSESAVGVRSPAGLHSITKMRVTLDPVKGKSVLWPPGVLSIHSDTQPNAQCSQEVEGMRELRAKLASKIIGVTSVPLIGTANLIRSSETNLGNLIADIMRYSLNTSFAFINSGAFKLDGDLCDGFITQGNILKILPNYDYVTVVRLTGKEILEILRNSVSRTPFPDGRFLQVSGISMEYTTEPLPKNDSFGSKCRFAKSGKKPIDQTITYTCAMTGFLLEGHDGYNKCFNKDTKSISTGPGGTGSHDTELAWSLQQMVYEFFKSRSSQAKGGDMEVITQAYFFQLFNCLVVTRWIRHH